MKEEISKSFEIFAKKALNHQKALKIYSVKE